MESGYGRGTAFTITSFVAGGHISYEALASLSSRPAIMDIVALPQSLAKAFVPVAQP